MASVKVLFAYVCYALLVAALFLYLLFPDEAVKAYVDNRLLAIDPLLTVSMETMQPVIPPGLKMTGVTLNRDSTRLAHFKDARVSPVLTTLLGDKKQARFKARVADGTIEGLAIMDDTDTSGRIQVEADLAKIRLDQIDATKVNDQFTLSGTLKGHVTHDGGRAPTGTTSGLLTVSELRIILKADFFGISELVMEQTDVEFSSKGQNLRIKSVTFNGPMLEGKITGTIQLKRPFGQSRLNLTGNAKPQPEFFARLQETIPQGLVNPKTMGTRGVTFRVGGSIDSPDVSLR